MKDFIFFLTLWVVLPVNHAIAVVENESSAVRLTLSEAIQMGLTHNRNVAASRLLADAEIFSVSAAESEFSLKTVPSLAVSKTSSEGLTANQSTFQGSVGVQLRKKFNIGMALSAEPTYYQMIGSADHSSALNLVLRQSLLKGFGSEINLDRVHRAEFDVKLSKQNVSQTKINTVLEVITAFYEALKQKQIAEINKSLAERLRQHVVLIGKKEKRGLTGPMDTYRALIRSKDAEESVARSENVYLNYLSKLKWLLNLSGGVSLELVPEKLPELDLTQPEEDVKRANVELIQLRTQKEEAVRLVRVAENTTLPDLQFQTNYRVPLMGPQPDSQQRWSIALQGSTDLFRGEEKNSFERAKIRAEAVEVTLQLRSSDINRQVQQSLLFIHAAKVRIDLRNAQIKEAEAKLALTKVKFAHDMTDNFELI
ncbi:MAG: TolC family protein, partial [Bdellovibrionota bacterium]